MSLTSEIKEKELQSMDKARFSREVFEDIKDEYLRLVLKQGTKYLKVGDGTYIHMSPMDIIELIVDSVRKLKPFVAVQSSVYYRTVGIFVGKERLSKNVHVFEALSYVNEKDNDGTNKTCLKDLIDFEFIDLSLHKYLMSYGFGSKKREARYTEDTGYLREYTASYKNFKKIVSMFESGEPPTEKNFGGLFGVVVALVIISSFVVFMKSCGG